MESQKWRLEGKRALVTGGTKGIGFAISQEILQLGGEICIIARDIERIKSCTEAWRKQGYEATGMVVDVSKPDELRQFFRQLSDRWEALDILINNAGMNIRKKAVNYSTEEYRSLTEINMHSTFEICCLAHGLLKESNAGSVVNILSVAGLTHLRTGAPYGMSKAAVHQLTKNLAVEWAKDGIRVNAVAPWYTRTAFVEHLLQDRNYREDILARTPLGRIAEPAEVAAAAIFFCLPAASFISGQCLAVDGGFMVNGF